ncbi:uncharacterized protein LOC119840761 isoform X3 [Zerene cesonia]|uniref:uncharacterized protein LOC119840761 isoform X3 n=1 Tax=Zerene cesonia TaxID=33412 RepID=UPI0018E4E909|nr:uncharacterized protein LOC119840761 isoform X3 [Zerene cesonia]XP_038223425.1 uncharacterized protein LOC119840761 isoform X3 [Zerene cesonia]
MGETTKAAGDGWTSARDGRAGDARAVGSSGGEAWSATQHTAARRRVRPGRAPAITSPLSASRADEKQLPTSAEQMRKRRARMGRRGGRAERATRRRRGRGRGCGGRGRCGCGRQEGWPATEGDAVVGAHGRAAATRLSAGRRTAALRDGAAPRRALAAARRVTSPRLRISLPYHAYIPLSGRSDSPVCPRVPEYYRLDNLFIWDSSPERAAERELERVLCDMCDGVVL